MECIDDQDTEAYEWHYRVLGYNQQGTVMGSLTCESDAALEATHDHVAAFPGTASTFVVGPFRTRRRVA